MRDFDSINGKLIIKKEVASVKAKENANFITFLEPEETVTVCNCIVKTNPGAVLLITGVRYPSLGWEHVLIRTNGRCPTHREMSLAKEIFWTDNEIVFQVYPPKSKNINYEKYTLHLWRNLQFKKSAECVIKKVSYKCYDIAKKDFKGIQKSLSIEDQHGKRIVIYGPMHWLTWEELVMEKEKFLGKEEAGVQFFISKEFDDNKEYVAIIWEAKGIRLPPKELV